MLDTDVVDSIKDGVAALIQQAAQQVGQESFLDQDQRQALRDAAKKLSPGNLETLAAFEALLEPVSHVKTLCVTYTQLIRHIRQLRLSALSLVVSTEKRGLTFNNEAITQLFSNPKFPSLQNWIDRLPREEPKNLKIIQERLLMQLFSKKESKKNQLSDELSAIVPEEWERIFKLLDELEAVLPAKSKQVFQALINDRTIGFDELVKMIVFWLKGHLADPDPEIADTKPAVFYCMSFFVSAVMLISSWQQILACVKAPDVTVRELALFAVILHELAKTMPDLKKTADGFLERLNQHGGYPKTYALEADIYLADGALKKACSQLKSSGQDILLDDAPANTPSGARPTYESFRRLVDAYRGQLTTTTMDAPDELSASFFEGKYKEKISNLLDMMRGLNVQITDQETFDLQINAQHKFADFLQKLQIAAVAAEKAAEFVENLDRSCEFIIWVMENSLRSTGLSVAKDDRLGFLSRFVKAGLMLLVQQLSFSEGGDTDELRVRFANFFINKHIWPFIKGEKASLPLAYIFYDHFREDKRHKTDRSKEPRDLDVAAPNRDFLTEGFILMSRILGVQKINEEDPGIVLLEPIARPYFDRIFKGMMDLVKQPVSYQMLSNGTKVRKEPKQAPEILADAMQFMIFFYQQHFPRDAEKMAIRYFLFTGGRGPLVALASKTLLKSESCEKNDPGAVCAELYQEDPEFLEGLQAEARSLPFLTDSILAKFVPKQAEAVAPPVADEEKAASPSSSRRSSSSSSFGTVFFLGRELEKDGVGVSDDRQESEKNEAGSSDDGQGLGKDGVEGGKVLPQPGK